MSTIHVENFLSQSISSKKKDRKECDINNSDVRDESNCVSFANKCDFHGESIVLLRSQFIAFPSNMFQVGAPRFSHRWS